MTRRWQGQGARQGLRTLSPQPVAFPQLGHAHDGTEGLTACSLHKIVRAAAVSTLPCRPAIANCRPPRDGPRSRRRPLHFAAAATGIGERLTRDSDTDLAHWVWDWP